MIFEEKYFSRQISFLIDFTRLWRHGFEINPIFPIKPFFLLDQKILKKILKKMNF